MKPSFVLGLLLLLVVACGPAPVTDRSGAATAPGRPLLANPEGCVASYDPDADYFPDKVRLEHADLALLSYHRHYKVLRVRFRGFADNPRFTSEETYVLVQCGTPVPDRVGVLQGAHVVQIPARTVSTTTNEDLGIVDALGLLSRLKSVGTRSVYPEALWDAVRNGRLPVTGGWGGEGPQLELLASLAPEAVIVGAFHSAVSGNMRRVRDLGLATVPSMNRMEPTPLGRAEWVKVLSTLFNMEKTANTLFTTMESRYRSIAGAARANGTQPTVFWGTTYAAGQWSVQRNTWQARMLEDAAAVNVLADDGPTSAAPVQAEVVVAEAGNADFWITENDNWSLGGDHELPGTRASELRSRRLGQVYYVCKRIRPENQGCDFYHTGPHRPDLLLEDLFAVLHPGGRDLRSLFFVINPLTRATDAP
jgi:iron complex transport system substrate-binding protein